MDLVNGGRFLLEMLKTNKIVDNVPIQPEGDMPLKMAQEYLLKNAQLHGSRFQYFSKDHHWNWDKTSWIFVSRNLVAAGKHSCSEISTPTQLSSTFTNWSSRRLMASQFITCGSAPAMVPPLITSPLLLNVNWRMDPIYTWERVCWVAPPYPDH